jgi:hypothetical protein
VYTHRVPVAARAADWVGVCGGEGVGSWCRGSAVKRSGERRGNKTTGCRTGTPGFSHSPSASPSRPSSLTPSLLRARDTSTGIAGGRTDD